MLQKSRVMFLIVKKKKKKKMKDFPKDIFQNDRADTSKLISS